MPSPQRPNAPQPPKTTSDGAFAAGLVVVIVVVVVLAPAIAALLAIASLTAGGLLAFPLAPRIAQRPLYWRHTRLRLAADVGGVAVVAVLGLVEAFHLVPRLWPLRDEPLVFLDALWSVPDLWVWLAVNLGASLLTVPAASRWARRRLASQVAQRLLPDAARQEKIAEARARAATTDTAPRAAENRSPHLSAEGQVIGHRVHPGVRVTVEREHARTQIQGWTTAQRVLLPSKPGACRALVLAESGAGKSTLLETMSLSALALGWDVLYLDAKGKHTDAEALVSKVNAAGFQARTASGLAVLGSGPQEALALLGRPYEARGSDGDYYRQRALTALRWVFRHAGGPRDLATLLDALRRPAAYGLGQDAITALTAKEHGTTLGEAAATQVHNDWGPLQGRLATGPGSWSFAAPLPGLTVMPLRPVDRDDKRLGQTVLAAYSWHLGQVLSGDRPARPLLVVADEFAQLVSADEDAADEASRLMETARTADLGLVIASQSAPGLSPHPESRQRLLGSGCALLIGRTKLADDLAGLFGSDTRLEAAGHADGSALTSGRAQHTYRLHPNALRQARVGQWWLYQDGQVIEFVAIRPTDAEQVEEAAA